MAEATMFPVEARGLHVRLGTHDALRGLDLAIGAGERVAILGANGAGKSVLLRTLHGLIQPSGGTLTWAGARVRPRAQAMVFQRPVMLRRTARENIEYALRVNGWEPSEAIARSMQVLGAVGLSHLASRQARVLSGGEQQRLALARAWALQPRLLYLDEPTASLDPAAAAEVESVIAEIHRGGTAIVFTTHNLGAARRLSEEIVFLHEGRITERTAADRFFERPASREAAEFLQGELPWNPVTDRSAS
jgi:tungstate transport system ATP-binding protein